jgi:hypothetical protein
MRFLAMSKRCLILICATFTLLGGTAVASAQDSSSQGSVADAARKAQAAKKEQPKPAKVYTNDNIGAVQGELSVVGTAPGDAATPSADSGAKPSASGGAEKKDEAYYRKKFAELNKKLAGDQKELDVLQREYGLKQQQYYSNPNTAMKEQYSRQDLDDTSKAIDAKKQDIADDQQAISDAEDDLRANGGDPGWERAAETEAPAPAESSSPAETVPPPAQQPDVAPSDTNAPPPTPAAEPSTQPSAPAAAPPSN